MAFFEEKIDQVTAYLEQQSPRDRMLALVAGIGGLLLALYVGNMVVGGSFSRQEGNNRDLAKQLAQISQLQGRFEAARRKVERLERRIKQAGRLNLLTFLDKLSQKHNINISSMTPVSDALGSDNRKKRLRERSVRVSISAADLGSLARFLDAIENSGKIVKVRQLKMSPNFSDPAKPDFNATISTYDLMQN
ncbi:MAG: hypothetical protein H6727_03920 [Myxococcales bacterium]|nr:hypothetical protein [Myxococcales bacterium]